MYEHILETKILTALAGAVLLVLVAAVNARWDVLWRAPLFSFGPIFAAAYFVLAPLAPIKVSLFDVGGGLLFELLVLFLFCRLLIELFTVVHTMREADARRMLILCLVLHIGLSAPLVGSEGFGLFSDGSRIDYLDGAAANKYVTYAALGLAGIEAGLIASQVSRTGSLGWLGLAAVLCNLALSVVAGSKGFVFLWLASVVALIDFRRAKISALTVAGALTGVVFALALSAYQVAEFLGVGVEEFADLALSRFFLNNDARALAFDLRPSVTAGSGLLHESFRSLASLFGHAPKNPPLGVSLYEQYFGSALGGANTSLSGLVIYYTSPGYALIPFIGAAAGALIVFFLVRGLALAVRSNSARYVVLSTGILVMQLISQDFLAFQVVMPMFLCVVALVWITSQWHVGGGACTGRTKIAAAS